MYDRTIDLLSRQETSHWQIADAVRAEVSNAQDWDNLAGELAARGLDFKLSTLKAYRRVAASFPASDRVAGVSFAAHQAALTAGKVADAHIALDRAQRNAGKVTRDTVLSEVRQMKGRASNDTNDAVAAWRDLNRGVEKILALTDHELEALLAMSGGTYAGQAPQLSKDLAKVSTKVAMASKAAEARLLKAKQAKVSKAPRATKAPAATAPVKDAPAKPKLGKLGQGRGE